MSPCLQDSDTYRDIETRVMWGETDAEIEACHAQGEPGPHDLQEMIRHARAERLRAIKAIHWRKMLLGLAAAVGSGLVILLTWHWSDGYTKWSMHRRAAAVLGAVIFLPYLSLGYGAWKFLFHTTGFLMPGSYRGPVSDIE